MEPDAGAGRVPAVNLQATAVYPGTQAVGVSQVDFAVFYGANRDRIVRAVTATIGDSDLAADAVDEAMARAYQRWHRVSGLDNPNGWVYRVAVNWATSVLRRRRRRPTTECAEGSYDAPAMAEPTVARALANLDVRQRAVVVCRYLLGWSEAETAAALKTPIGTVKSRLHRANRHLSASLSHLRNEEQR